MLLYICIFLTKLKHVLILSQNYLCIACNVRCRGDLYSKMTCRYSLASFTFLLEQALQDLCPNFRTKCRSSLLFFSGCLCSFGLLYGRTGIDQTRAHDLEDDLVSIYLYIMIVWMGRISICTVRAGICWIIQYKRATLHRQMM